MVMAGYRVVRWGGIKRLVNFWRLQQVRDGAVTVEFYRRRGVVTVTRIRLALDGE